MDCVRTTDGEFGATPVHARTRALPGIPDTPQVFEQLACSDTLRTIDNRLVVPKRVVDLSEDLFELFITRVFVGPLLLHGARLSSLSTRGNLREEILKCV